MHRYGVSDVERLLGLSRGTINALVKAGFVSPARGARNALQFSFQDLIVLRTAQALLQAKVPQRRITKSLRELRKGLPDAMPLSGLSITAVGDRVVVREGGQRWQADSGQYLLGFEGDPAKGSIGVVERNAPSVEDSGEDLFMQALELEANDPKAAIVAYQRAIEAAPGRVDTRINLGRLLHEARRLREAERVYVDGIEACGPDALLLFNLAVLLDDSGRKSAALEVYESAIKVDPELADAHYNASLLCQSLGRPREAIRHMAHYRKLARS